MSEYEIPEPEITASESYFLVYPVEYDDGHTVWETWQTNPHSKEIYEEYIQKWIDLYPKTDGVQVLSGRKVDYKRCVMVKRVAVNIEKWEICPTQPSIGE